MECLLRLLAFFIAILISFPALSAPNVVHGTYYHPKFNGRTMACGGTYSDEAYTAASNHYPCGTIVEVEYRGRTVLTEVTDRCSSCGIDLSRAAARELGLIRKGRARVTVTPQE